MKTSYIKKTAIIAIIAFTMSAVNAPELKAQDTDFKTQTQDSIFCNSERKAGDPPFDPGDFSMSIDFTREEIDLGYYGGSWDGNVWLAKEPYHVSLKGVLEPMPYLNDVYPLKLVVYIHRPDFLYPPDGKSKTGLNGKSISKGIFKVPEDANPKLLKKYKIGPERINITYKTPADAKAARLRQSEIVRQKILSPASKEKGRGEKHVPVDDPYGEPDWRKDYIKIAPLPPQIDPVCEIRKDMQTTCDLGEIPVHEITRLVTVNINGSVATLCVEGPYPSEGENFWVNDSNTIAVVEVKDPNYDPSNPDSQEYLPVRVQSQWVGNLEAVGIDGTVSKYREDNPNVELTYNLLPSMPVNAYGVMLRDPNAFCLWDYDAETFNSVYDAIHGKNGMSKGGYDGGFERFKQTVQAACGDDVIGFVKLNKKTPQGQWLGWKGWVIEEPSVVMLGEKEGCPFAVDSDRTIASGGDFAFADFVISNDPEAFRTLPTGAFPGKFSGGNLSIPPADNPPKPCKPDVSIDDPSIGDIVEFYGNAIVINESGKGIFRIYDIQGRQLYECSVSGKTSIDLRPYQQNRAMYFLNYTNETGHYSKKVGVGR